MSETRVRTAPRSSKSHRRLRLDLEHRTPGGSAATARRAIQIAGGVENQTILRTEPVMAIVAEAVQRRLRPISFRGRRQFENCTVAASAIRGGRAIKIARGIEDQTRVRSGPARSTLIEVIENLLAPIAALPAHQLGTPADP